MGLSNIQKKYLKYVKPAWVFFNYVITIQSNDTQNNKILKRCWCFL